MLSAMKELLPHAVNDLPSLLSGGSRLEASLDGPISEPVR